MILRPGTFLQDRYEILDQIGSGGMSDVYKALCHKLNRPVAIKVLKEEFSSDSGFVSKFKMEAQAAARLSHPNIVNIYDVVDEGNLHYIVMELIEGITLKNYITKKGCLDVKEAIGVAISVAQGIAAAHEQGIIHRDIKPQNIIIARDGKVKVADFGIARAASSQTLSATAVGSVHYISPEQARGGYSDVRSDVYSLGITMYEMVAGRVPFQGDNTVTVALAHLEDPITPPSFYNENIPVGLENIILKCTEKKPEYRYGSMQEVISDLRKALVNPDGDFVQYNSQVDDSQTVIIGKPELEQIRSGRKVQADPVVNRNGNRNQEQRPERRQGKNAGAQPGSSRTRKQDSEDDINPKIERLLTAAGVMVAVLIVVVLVIVFSKVGGLFRSGSPKETESTAEISTEETLSDKKVKMTSVVGLATDIAEQKLKDNGGLYMKVSDYVFHDTIDKGDIVSQDPAEGTVIDKYSAVYVVVSKGPEHATIDLTKLGLEKMDGTSAKAVLEGNGLTVNVEQKNSETVVSGYVISYTPDAAKEGETVTLVLSSGPALVNPVTVPDITGQTQEIAVEMLADVGLVQGTVTEAASETVLRGSVISQSLTANSQVESGTAVNYVISSGTAQQSKVKYLASIEKSYPLQNIIGPGSGSTQLTLKIQLKQSVNGKDEIRELMGPVTMAGDQVLPVSFKNIEGAYGISSGTVEIVNVETGDVINSYVITFIPVPQS
ncbi:MAG: Stk1 family PASTA domain-containing Ser/Thr kinase [Hungatella sp.]|jgi:serine/threonine-protein kinase|nr:Stk1 family PASTA domain-containing Ser/Thr kinase [Hungatella sp.]MDR1550821.1 Stk1 family PASTA domain-containing Ser/Thr kinase [Hungatella sp.]